jgi:hypothetical protein
MLRGPIAQFVMRRRWLTALIPLAVIACGGSSSPPPESPTAELLAAASSAGPPAPPPSAPEEVEAKKNKFDEEQARIVLARAAANAHTCVDIVDKGEPHGDATVIVTFSGRGKSTKASIGTPYDSTPIGACATRAFVNIIVPPFEGPDVELLQQVDLKLGDKSGDKSAKKPAAKPKK